MKRIIIVIIILLAGEFSLRYFFGFCDTVLIKEDAYTEYIAQPNQERQRFGNRIIYNRFSMRSPEVDSSATLILGMGDSVINGGAPTDQKELATSMLSETLSQQNDDKVQVLNISYGSWGPNNNFGYIKEFGDFGAKYLFLIVSSHDAHDNMTFRKVVGLSSSLPNEQYKTAYGELLNRYLIPKISKIFTDKSTIEKKLQSKEFNKGFDNLLSYTDNHKMDFFVYLHPERAETKRGNYDSYGQEIIEWAEKNNVELIKGLQGSKESFYRDYIHYNAEGQMYLYKKLLPKLEKLLD